MAKARTLVELRPDKNLLDPEFQGYKLSLDSVPLKQISLKHRPDSVSPSDDQYSFLHTKVFALQNKLYSDPWVEENIYFIDEKWNVVAYRDDNEISSGGCLCEVCEVPSHHERQAGHYNLSMSFASSDLVVIGDGAGTLHVVASGDRGFFGRKWEILFSCEPIGKENGFIVMDARYYCDELHCLLLHVAEGEAPPQCNSEAESKELKSRFTSVIDWITLTGEDNNWSIHAIRQLVGPGSVDYAALEQSCAAIYVASDFPVKFVSDSESPILEKDESLKEQVQVKPQIIFSWLQTGDDITLWLPLLPDVSKSDVKVTVTALALQISICGKDVLLGNLYQRVDVDSTSWTFQPQKLEVILNKAEVGLAWPEVLIDNKQGEEILDSAFVEEVHQRLAHLCSENVETEPSGSTFSYNSQQLEDCDAFPRDSAALLRLDSKDHSISHQANLGGHQWLFNTRLEAGTPPAICVRHDVDACIWQLEEVNRETGVWPVSHIGTFHAFGYVQASKQQRKFMVCSPDMSFVAICDSVRHLYLYRQPATVDSELRNRFTGRRVAQIAKQQIVQLETSEHILGCQATKKCVFLLTADSLHKLSVI